MTEPPPIRCVLTVPGFHAASILPVSRTTFNFTIRMSVILSGTAERNCGISDSKCGIRTATGADFRKSLRCIGTGIPPLPDIERARGQISPCLEELFQPGSIVYALKFQ